MSFVPNENFYVKCQYCPARHYDDGTYHPWDDIAGHTNLKHPDEQPIIRWDDFNFKPKENKLKDYKLRFNALALVSDKIAPKQEPLPDPEEKPKSKKQLDKEKRDNKAKKRAELTAQLKQMENEK